ncbi:MAG: NADH-quinone oxidoreductase subunit J [Anaerolineae bacterium]|nr:NADH-quinone oxidoreductase subunit J [Phycisphaerae bacterium]
MLGASTSLTSSLATGYGLHAPSFLAQTLPIIAQGSPSMVPLSPTVILILCAIAGVGTVLLLPGRRETPIRAIGGMVLLAAGLIFAAILIRWTAGHPRGGMGLYFWLFSAIAIGGAIRVITHSRPVYSALYFVLTVFATAGLFMLLWAEFMAAALILIYAGAILVTYVFVIMLASEATSPATNLEGGGALSNVPEHDAVSREPLAACAVGFALMGVLLFIIFDRFDGAETNAVNVTSGSTRQLGEFLFNNHVVSLELAGLILTIAMVGSIMIARKRVIVVDEPAREMKPETVIGPATPVDDNPHSIPVDGTLNPRQKAYPET